MPSVAQLYQWLREHHCECAVDDATNCMMYREVGDAKCKCECHKKIAEYHNDRRYS